jgi:hypothetical protein
MRAGVGACMRVEGGGGFGEDYCSVNEKGKGNR